MLTFPRALEALLSMTTQPPNEHATSRIDAAPATVPAMRPLIRGILRDVVLDATIPVIG